MSERPRSNDIRPHMRQPTPTTDRDELVASVIERFRWRVERKQFAPSVAEDLTLMMDRIQADAATIAAKDAAVRGFLESAVDGIKGSDIDDLAQAFGFDD